MGGRVLSHTSSRVTSGDLFSLVGLSASVIGGVKESSNEQNRYDSLSQDVQ